MMFLAGAEIVIVFAGILLFIWRLQFVFPDFAWYLLAFIILSFVLHRDGFQKLGFGTRAFRSATRLLIVPTVIISILLILIGIVTGSLRNWAPDWDEPSGFARYFAWCLFQQFGLQSFFTNRLFDVLKNTNRTAWISGLIFAALHIPNPVLMPVTFAGALILARVFVEHRNLVPLALAQAIIGTLISMTIPATWHHGLRVGPGYYQFHGIGHTRMKAKLPSSAEEGELLASIFANVIVKIGR
jgi:membrane protease YdiL (CAAX protease family)